MPALWNGQEVKIPTRKTYSFWLRNYKPDKINNEIKNVFEVKNTSEQQHPKNVCVIEQCSSLTISTICSKKTFSELTDEMARNLQDIIKVYCRFSMTLPVASRKKKYFRLTLNLFAPNKSTYFLPPTKNTLHEPNHPKTKDQQNWSDASTSTR